MSPVVLGPLTTRLGDAGGLVPLLALGGIIGLVVHPRTRRFGLGTLLGFGILLIILAGACIAIIAAIVEGLS